MNKIVKVHFPYSPKNDDELELAVGDEIEVIGVEEEGWWKGRLKGRIGVFPSNFVEPAPSATPSSIQQQHSATSNKLNSIFGAKVGSKSSLSNSLNTINSTSNNSLNNNPTFVNSNNSNNLASIMSNSMNTHQPEQANADPHNNQNESYDESNNNSSSERRPKPVRGIGYGDIFAAGAKPRPSQSIEPAKGTPTGSIVASERLSSGLIGGTLQKPVPKKPPPPAPVSSSSGVGGGPGHDQKAQNGSISSTSDQAPALPPKPTNQTFSPFMLQSRLMSQSQTNAQSMQRGQVCEQARVIHAYEPTNDDELTLHVNDVINVLDKKSEDQGWWKGELNGKIGVFPDNFVQLIPMPTEQTALQATPSSSALASASQPEWSSTNRTSGSGSVTAATASTFSPPQQQQISSTESRVKSVFSSTPKGFSKELESNLEKHSNNPASFLSLKRNKLASGGQPTSVANDTSSTFNTGFISSISRNDILASQHTTTSSQNGHSSLNPLESSSSTKLNHITANRTKGPTRRPPSNVLNRRGQLPGEGPYGSAMKKETPGSNDTSGEEHHSSIINSPISDRAASTTMTTPTLATVAPSNTAPPTPHIMPNYQLQDITKHVVSSNTPVSVQQHTEQAKQSAPVTTGPLATGNSFTSLAQNGNHVQSAPPSSSSSSSLAAAAIKTGGTINGGADHQPLIAGAASMAAPKTSLRGSGGGQQVPAAEASHIKSGQKTPTSATGSPPTSTPPWMVNLRKTNAEKKREPSIATTPPTSSAQAPAMLVGGAGASTIAAAAAAASGPVIGSSLTSSATIAAASTPTSNSSNQHQLVTAPVPSIDPINNGHQQVHESAKTSSSAFVAKAIDPVVCAQIYESLAKYENLYKQMSQEVTSELGGLKRDVKQLQEDLKNVLDLKSTIESIKNELKICQTATENQGRYIKDLVNNLADERKKIASMQVKLESDRSIK